MANQVNDRHRLENGDVTAEFGEWILKLAAGTRTTNLTEATTRVYAAALGDLSMRQLDYAAARCIQQKDFFPSIAELRRQIIPSVDDAALLAWTALSQAASKVGGYGSIEFEDASAAAAVKVVFGSWPAVCDVAGEGPGWASKRQEFLAAYRVARSTRRHAGPARLPGICEQAGRALPPGATVLVGRVSTLGEVSTAPRSLQIEGRRDVAAVPAHTQTRIAQESEGPSRTRGSGGQEGSSS